MSEFYRSASNFGLVGPRESRLSGTGCFADDLWLVAHHEVTGRPRLRARPLGLGLAAGLLAELMTGAHPAILLWPDDAITLAPGILPQAAGRHPLLKLILAEPQALTVRDWLQFLSKTATAEVGSRLEQAGYVMRSPRRLPRLPPRLVPVDRDWAFAPITRIGAVQRRTAGTYGVVLAGLAVACGLGHQLDLYLTDAEPAIEAAVACLPDDLRQLIVQTQIAVSAKVLART
jgi:hypothetical protein